PLVLGAALHSSELINIDQPFWLQASASLVLGWYIGLGFNRSILISAFRMLPRLMLSTVLLIILCGLSAWMMVLILGTPPLTAYLSTSPGGLESIILIAMGSEADIPFVIAVQTLRLFVVILIGPSIARLICRYA
ncbi:MAG: AbrB family transcriptional regulator, partial [Betaproteobacteria bacterium]